MVVQGDMKVEIVYADTKMPFLEHVSKDGKIYVEVEPDCDYFISVQRVDNKQGEVIVSKYFVDEQDLGYQWTTTPKHLSHPPKVQGIWAQSKGVSTMKALRFTKPRISEDGSNVNRNLMMGKVEIKVYEGVFTGYQKDRKDFSSNFAAKAVDINQTGLAKKKSLRSGEGEVSESTPNGTGKRAMYKSGTHLDTITLNYCAALGLMEVGVLQKPDAWTYHRMKRPAEAGQGPLPPSKKIRDVGAAEEKSVELFDLADGGSDEE